jgi:hypothetical protein
VPRLVVLLARRRLDKAVEERLGARDLALRVVLVGGVAVHEPRREQHRGEVALARRVRIAIAATRDHTRTASDTTKANFRTMPRDRAAPDVSLSPDRDRSKRLRFAPG